MNVIIPDRQSLLGHEPEPPPIQAIKQWQYVPTVIHRRKRQRQSTARELAKVIIGAVIGLAAGLAILHYVAAFTALRGH